MAGGDGEAEALAVLGQLAAAAPPRWSRRSAALLAYARTKKNEKTWKNQAEAPGAASCARVGLAPASAVLLLFAASPWVLHAARPRDASLSSASQQADTAQAASAAAVYQVMTDLADATARWSAKSLGLRLRRSWHVAGRRAALVSVAAHSGGSQRALQSRSSRQRPLVDGQAEEGGGPPKEGSGDYPGDTSDVNFPKYDQGINAMIDQCKKPKEIKEKAMSGEDTRRAKEVNLHMLSEYEKCVEKIHALAHLVQEGGDYSREQNKDYTEKAIQFLQELAFIEDYTKSFRNINGDLVTATKYLLKESIKVTKYLNDLVDRGDPVELAKPAHDPWA